MSAISFVAKTPGTLHSDETPGMLFSEQGTVSNPVELPGARKVTKTPKRKARAAETIGQ